MPARARTNLIAAGKFFLIDVAVSFSGEPAHRLDAQITQPALPGPVSSLRAVSLSTCRIRRQGLSGVPTSCRSGCSRLGACAA